MLEWFRTQDPVNLMGPYEQLSQYIGVREAPH